MISIIFSFLLFSWPTVLENMEDEDGLSAFEILKDELRAWARTARETERRDLSEQFFKSELFLGKYESRFKDLIDSRRRKLRSACISHPGQKRFSQPILEPPILFQDNEPVTKIFAYNIKDKNLTREKIAELFTAHGLSGFHINRVNTVAGTTTVSCDRLEISCEIQCLALLSTFTWSYFSSKTNKSYSGIIKFRQNNAFLLLKFLWEGRWYLFLRHSQVILNLKITHL